MADVAIAQDTPSSLQKSQANQLFINPLPFTNRIVRSYNMVCTDPSQIHFTLNGQPFNYTSGFFGYGFYDIEFPFGSIKPGDVLRITDDCGSTPFERTVTDDFVYVEVPNGSSYTGNGIGPTDEFSPYSKLVTPVKIGKCEPIAINAHVLCPITLFNQSTSTPTGAFLVNGVPIKVSDFNISFNGQQNVNYTVGTNGSILTDGNLRMDGIPQFSGSSTVTLEYRHNGTVIGGDFMMAIGGVRFRRVRNNEVTIEKSTYTNDFQDRTITGNFTNSVFKITFDQAYYRMYIDNVLVDELKRFVVYSASGGVISNTNPLDYRTGVTYTPTTTGTHWVTAVVDGVRFVQQKFQIADDITINESVVNIACSGGSSGKITVNVTGGQPGYTYALNSGAYGSSNVFSNLAAGSYTIKVRDRSGCEMSKTTSISQSSSVEVSISSQSPVTCGEVANGSVTLSASGGAPPYSYSKDGTNYGSSASFTGLAEGNYTLYVKDASGCAKSIAVSIGLQSKLIASVSAQQNISCFGGNNGSITINTTGSISSGAIQYSLDGINYQSSNQFGGLSAKTYQVRVKDNVCQKSINVTLTEPSAIVLTATVNQHVSCFGGNNAQINASASGGVGGYQYSINGATYGSSAQFSSLSANNYKIWVKDANGCIKESGIVTVSQPSELIPNVVSVSAVKCFGGNDGSVQLSAAGGTAPYEYAKTGGNYQASSNISGLSAGASQSFTIRDSKNCLKTVTATITQPAARLGVAVVSKSDLTCFQNNTGRIEVNANGGTAGYQFSLDAGAFQGSGVFGSLPAKTYNITGKDANGCTANVSVVLNQPALLEGNVNITNNLCFGDQTGKLSGIASGGTTPYQYSLDGQNYQSSTSFNNLTAGNYTVHFKDAQNCRFSRNITVSQPTRLEASANVTQQVSCFEGSNAVALIQAKGGTTPYFYSKDGTNYQNNATFTGLSATTYSMHVKDANGCALQTNSVTPTQPTNLIPSVVEVLNVKCFNGSDGSIQLAASGGVAPYQYSRDNIAYQGSSLFGNLPAATYQLTVKDANSCTKTLTATVTHPSLFTLSQQSKQDLTCFGNNSGQIQVTGNGGTGPYQYSLNNTDFQPSGLFTGLAAQGYTIFAKDAHNCATQLTTSFNQPSEISLTVLSKKDIDCEYYARGEFKVVASGSLGNFTYLLSGTDFTQNPVAGASNNEGVFSQLKAGNYTITARDHTGCAKDFPVTLVPKNSRIRFEVAKNHPTSCTSTDGSVAITVANGGRQPYTYRISSQNHFSTNNTFSNLTNGTYYVTVADSLCAYTELVDLSLPGSIRASYTISPISCATPNANLSIDNTTGGTGNYTYAIDGNSFSPNRQFNNLKPNLYAITIQDNPLSCKSVVSVEIKEQNRADLKIAERRDVSCFGGNNGYLKALGDNNTGPFTFAINNGSFSSSPEFHNLTLGTYKITAQNRLGCIDSIRVVITQPTPLTGNHTTRPNNCFGDQTGQITASSSGGTPPYQFSIDGNNYQTPVEFNNLFAGQYSLNIRDALGCIFTQSVNLTQPSLVVPTPVVLQHVNCFGGQDGKTQLNVQGGIAPYQYSTDGTNYTNENSYANLKANTYAYWVRDAHGCTKTISIEVTQPTDLIPSVVRIEAVKCFAGSDGAVELAGSGGVPPYQYSRDQTQYQSQSVIWGLKEGANQVFYVRDAHNCLKSITATVTQPAKPVFVKVASKKDLLCFQDNTGQIELLADGGTAPYQYSLDNASYQSSTIFDRLAAGPYRLFIKDANQCPFEVTTTLTQPDLLVSTLTPKHNDCFGDNTGRIKVTGKGGTLPYQYALNGGNFQAPDEFGGLVAGEYSVQLKDAHACLVTQTVAVIQPTLVQLKPIYADTVRCFGESNGSVRIIASGGTPGYVYSKDGTNYVADETFKNLNAGQYQFWVKDANQCLHKTQIAVTQPTELQLSLTERKDPLCAGDQNGRIQVKASGGNSSYIYTLDNAIHQSVGLFEGLTQADYTLLVTDRKGCIDTITRVRLNWPRPMFASLNYTTPTCVGLANGSIQLQVAGGVPPFKVGLNNASSQTVQTNTTFANLNAGIHRVNVADQNGCLLRLYADIPAPVGLNPIQLGDSAVVCKEQIVRLKANNVGQETQWFFNNQPLSKQDAIEAVAPGVYRVVVRNPTGCEVTGSFKLINNNKAMKADFLMPVQAFVGDTVYALNISSPTPDEVKWEFPPQAYGIEKNLQRGAFVLTNSGKYTIKMLARKGECENEKQRDIELFFRKDIDQTEDQLGYKNQQSIEEVIVYPNPNYGKFRLDIKLKKSSDVEVLITRFTTASLVYQTSGKAQQQYTFEVQLPNVVQDIYIITIRAGTASYSQKILVLN